MKFFYCFIFVISNITLAVSNDSLWVEFSGDTVNIWNSAELNCCSSINFEVEINNFTVKLTEVDTSKEWCKCTCNFNLCASLTGLKPGKYTVDIYRKHLIHFPNDSLYDVGRIQFSISKGDTSTLYLAQYQSECIKEIGNEVLIYSNSFEYAKDTVGWQGYIEFNSDAAPGSGKQSAYISGGCIWPHAWFILPPLNEAGYFILRCWGKDLQAGGIAGIMAGDNHLGQALISVQDSEWKNYETSDTLYCPSGESITLFLGAGGIIPSEMLIDKLEILRIKGASIPSGIIEDALVQKFELQQNYPNPFNPSTKIRYSIPPDNIFYNVELKVYDLLGNVVAILIDKQQTSGSFEIEFDAGNLASGVYFYTLKVDNKSKYRKMVLIR